jgi:hypothetical protein
MNHSLHDLSTASLTLFMLLMLAGALNAQNATVSFRTGDLSGNWCPILDSTGTPIDSGSYIGFYLVGPDEEVDPPSQALDSCGAPTDDDVRALHNTIGNGLDHYILGYNEPPFVPAGNLSTGNGAVLIPDSGSGEEPVLNRGDRFYMRAFDSDSVHTATHYFNLLTVDGDTMDSYIVVNPGPAVTMVCFTDPIPLDCESSPVGPEDAPNIVGEYRLYQNYPNPFNPTTTINYDVKEHGRVTLKIYNVLGQEVRTLVDGLKDTGEFSATFNAADLASGIYFYELRVNSYRDVKKMVLLQ